MRMFWKLHTSYAVWLERHCDVGRFSAQAGKVCRGELAVSAFWIARRFEIPSDQLERHKSTTRLE